ncbi:predicted protein [Verticillium alfalfae VaMs.102]|uniref:Predicted protein n=1 Tax=Verticillium alfalfae (strain VaMs.102 / ATCC MYA-4576 / FGSC 10136) TaxID=526221 RepID=C9SQB1_VERA1|nr:predicted protein [Verticillium alfalfae VaMs.102]EEY21036.1 predicted protein [Verticillium alfalfae VaMs.102]
MPPSSPRRAAPASCSSSGPSSRACAPTSTTSTVAASTCRNFGSTWLKPPGVPKTLHQMREERREAEEHAEAVPREQLQQELAEPEEGGGPQAQGKAAAPRKKNATADMEDLGDGARDLGRGDSRCRCRGHGANASSGDGDDDGDDGSRAGDGPGRGEALREERRAELVQARMRMARGGDDDVYGADEEEIEAETEGQLLLEDEGDSFLPVHGQVADEDLDMDADLDGSMADGAELSGVYEHTDTEAELSSSLPSDSSDAEDEEDVGFAPRSSLGAGVLRPPTSPTMQGRGQTPPRQDMDLSSLLSGGDSSMLGSSPQARASRSGSMNKVGALFWSGAALEARPQRVLNLAFNVGGGASAWYGWLGYAKD